MSPTNSQPAQTVHVSGERPAPAQLMRELRDVAVAAPLAVTAPLLMLKGVKARAEAANAP